jgi:hypothetical protein
MESKGKATAALEAVSLNPMVAAIPAATRWQAMRAVVLRELGRRASDPGLSAVSVDQRAVAAMQLGGWANDDLVDALSELNRRLRAASEDRWSDVTAEVLMLLDERTSDGRVHRDEE